MHIYVDETGTWDVYENKETKYYGIGSIVIENDNDVARINQEIIDLLKSEGIEKLHVRQNKDEKPKEYPFEKVFNILSKNNILVLLGIVEKETLKEGLQDPAIWSKCIGKLVSKISIYSEKIDIRVYERNFREAYVEAATLKSGRKIERASEALEDFIRAELIDYYSKIYDKNNLYTKRENIKIKILQPSKTDNNLLYLADFVSVLLGNEIYRNGREIYSNEKENLLTYKFKGYRSKYLNNIHSNKKLIICDIGKL